MAKVGRFVTDPRAGAYCHITLDSGQRIMVSHDKGGFKGGTVSLVELKWLGLASGETILSCALDTPQGQRTLEALAAGARPDSVDATPLGAFVNFVSDCGSIAEVKAKCARLLPEAGARGSGG
ncbi:MAG TPA: hypothetical protein VGT40_19845 [Methylomirabilota bacterium]|nr:hypothetical protein [Methylomirabilota bacterium]